MTDEADGRTGREETGGQATEDGSDPQTARDEEGRLPPWIRLGRGTVYLHTDRGIELVDRLAASPVVKGWHRLAWPVMAVSMVVSIFTILFSGWRILSVRPEPTAVNDPVNLVAIPGVNDFMPLVAAGYVVVALVIALVVHEGGHAVAARIEGVPLREFGLVLVGPLPMGAYVLPDEGKLEAAPAPAQVRVLAAGVLNNWAVTGVATLLLVAPVTGSILDAYLAYFGALTGADPGAITELGVATNLLFWTWFLNLNVAVINSLPIAALDGGRIWGLLATERGFDRRTAVWASSLLMVGVMAAVILGPHVLG